MLTFYSYFFKRIKIRIKDKSKGKQVAELIKNKEHLSEPGFSKIIKIVEQMNLDRKIFSVGVLRKVKA